MRDPSGFWQIQAQYHVTQSLPALNTMQAYTDIGHTRAPVETAIEGPGNSEARGGNCHFKMKIVSFFLNGVEQHLPNALLYFILYRLVGQS
jgi:hypothetical protein